jgi:alpha-L-rhamnosidase
MADEAIELKVVVPAGTRAEVVLPDGRIEIAGPGVHAYISIVAPSDTPELMAR